MEELISFQYNLFKRIENIPHYSSTDCFLSSDECLYEYSTGDQEQSTGECS